MKFHPHRVEIVFHRVASGISNTVLTEPTRQIKTTFPMNIYGMLLFHMYAM